MNSLRKSLYRLASLLGDLNAISKGPSAMAKRMVRKRMTRGVFGLLGKLFK